MKRVERCPGCGEVMRRLYVRESRVVRRKGLLGERKEYKQRYEAFAWYCEQCRRLVFEGGGEREDLALVPLKVWERVKAVLLADPELRRRVLSQT